MGARLAKLTVAELIDALAADSATPGGGSAAALAGALGAAVGCMAASVTQRRQPDQKLQATSDRLYALARRLLQLVDADSDAFDAVIAARHLPREDSSRSGAIGRAFEAATRVPLDTAESAAEAYAVLRGSVADLTKAVASDAEVGLSLLRTATLGAIANVEINLPHLDASLAGEFRQRTKETREEISGQRHIG